MISLKQLRISIAIGKRMIVRHRRRTVFVLVMSGIALLCFYQIIHLLFIQQNEQFVEGMVGQYTRNDLPPIIGNLTSVGLTKITPSGQATASAAIAWQLSKDGHDYTFTLNPNLHWQDGTPLSSNDLTQLFDTNGTVKTTVISQNQIQFHLSTPYSPFPVLLAKPLYKGSEMIGLGQYKFTNIDEMNGFVSDVTIANVADPTKTITFRFYPTAKDMVTAYKLGELKAMTGVIPAGSIPKWTNFSYYKRSNYHEQVTLFFNLRDTLLGDKTVREGLSYAVNKDAMPGEPAFSPISPNSWAFNPDVKQYVYDLHHAKDLLNQAAVASNSAITIATSEQTIAVANQIAASWRQLGLTVTVSPFTDIPKNFQTLVITQQIPDDPDQYALWHSLAKETNISGYSEERIDKLLEDGRTISDTAQRKQKYLDFQRFLVEDDPALFLYYPTESLYINKRFDTPFYRTINGF